MTSLLTSQENHSVPVPVAVSVRPGHQVLLLGPGPCSLTLLSDVLVTTTGKYNNCLSNYL